MWKFVVNLLPTLLSLFVKSPQKDPDTLATVMWELVPYNFQINWFLPLEDGISLTWADYQASPLKSKPLVRTFGTLSKVKADPAENFDNVQYWDGSSWVNLIGFIHKEVAHG